MMIDNTKQLKAAIRSGPYAWPGGYTIIFFTLDGSALAW